MKSRPATLPPPGAGTMLGPVPGSTPVSRLRGVTRRGLLGLVALSVLAPSLASAQAADDSTWFDPPPQPIDNTPPAAYYDPPGAEAPPATGEIADTDASALTTFRPTLDPYGSWVDDSTYGTVWVPNAAVVGTDFAPYVSRGHWALTADDDWIWVSDYPFGWAVFHYGRWVWISGHGWSWVPGRTYANAWVVWRVPTAGYAYVGWAPMPPSWVWVNGGAVTLWYSPPMPYVFCPSAYVFDYHVHHHIVHDHHLVHTIASHSRVYPTTYHRPARPSTHTAAAPTTRSAPPPRTAAPRGPHIAAARVPPSSLPSARTAPPPAATRLAGTRRVATTNQVTHHRVGADQLRPRTSAPSRAPSSTPERVRAPAPSRSVSPEAVRRTAPSTELRRVDAPRSAPRASPPARVRAQPRATSPSHFRPAPSRSAPSGSNLRHLRRR